MCESLAGMNEATMVKGNAKTLKAGIHKYTASAIEMDTLSVVLVQVSYAFQRIGQPNLVNGSRLCHNTVRTMV